MIIAFDKPHPIGSICRYPCRHCGDREGASSELTDGHGSVDVRSVAMLIVREVSRQDWRDFCVSMGATRSGEPPPYGRFYEVQTD